MTTDPLNDAVAGQYRRWVYPEPIIDLDAWLVDNWEWFDPIHAQPLLWPSRDPRPDLAILVAGCGANQAAVIARNNPTATVTGIDVSDSSLDHHRRLARLHGIDNLDLHLLPIERVDELGLTFDLIITTGVLHHMAEPTVGMTALGRCLEPDGVLAVMLYAKYGRLGVTMLQEVFNELGLGQNEDSLEIVRSTIGDLPHDHPLRAYLSIAPDLAHDTGLIDTFLHERDRSFTVDDCLDLVAAAGLAFDDWFLKAPYQPHDGLGPDVLAALSQLPDRRRWAVMERINWRNGCHFFTACRPERFRSSYVVDFGSPAAVNYRPSLRHRCSVTEVGIARNDWSATLDAQQSALVRRIDGQRTLGEIAEGCGDLETAITLFERLWRLDFISVCLPNDTAPN